MPKEKVTKPHHKLAVTTVSLVSFHDLLPCFPNDTLILNPFSLYTHRHDKILSGVKRDDELYKISANSYWPDKQFEDQGYTIIRHFSFPASMNVRQKLLASEYVTRLYFAEGHLNDVYRIIRNEHPLNEW